MPFQSSLSISHLPIFSQKTGDAVVAVPSNAGVPGTDTDTPKPSRLRKFVRFVFVTSVLVVAFAFVAPMIIAKTELRQHILPTIFPDYSGNFDTGGASLSWFAPVVLNDVTGYDTAGQPLLKVPQVESGKKLWELALDASRLGRWTLTRPHIDVRLRKDGSNLEDTLTKMITAESSGALMSFEVSVAEGTMKITDEANSESVLLSELAVDFVQPYALTDPLVANVAAKLGTPDTPGVAGKFETELTWTLPTEEETLGIGKGQLVLKTQDLRLDTLTKPLRGLLDKSQLGGVLVSDIALSWQEGNGELHLKTNGRLTATQLALGIPDLFGEEQLRAEFFATETDLELNAGQLAIAKFAMNSDAAKLDVHGGVDLNRIGEWTDLDKLTATLNESNLAMSANIDLARLAKMLPQTVRLREGLEITEGTLSASLQPQDQDGVRLWNASVGTSRLVGNADGQEIAWEHPLTVEATARITPDGPQIDKILCESDFLQLRAQGHIDDATLEADCDLNRLTTEAGRFVDLGGLELSGQLSSRFTCRKLGHTGWKTAATATANDFALAIPGQPKWTENNLTITASGDYSSAGDANQIQNASLQVRSGDDDLIIRQTAACEWPLKTESAFLRAELKGDLQRWATRLKPIVNLDGWTIQGATSIVTDLEYSPVRVAAKNLIADFEPLRIDGDGIHFAQRQVRVQGGAEWQTALARLVAPELTWASPALSVRVDGLDGRFSTDTPGTIAGNVIFRGDLPTVLAWMQDPRTSPTYQTRGIATGEIQLAVTDSRTGADWNLQIENPVVIDPQTPNTPVFADNRVACQGKGVYDSASDRVVFERLTLLGGPIELSCVGEIKKPATECLVNLTGQFACDMNSASERLRPWIGNDIRFAGRQTRDFAIRGPAFAPLDSKSYVAEDLLARISIGWDGLSAYGLQGGGSELTADIANGTLRLGPLNQSLISGQAATGRAKLGTTLPLRDPLVATIDNGSGLDNVVLSQELCGQWLKYVAPLLADSTRADGQFSLRLAGGQVPLADPMRMNTAGVLAIEQARVRPGPVAAEMFKVAQQVKSLINRGANGQVADPEKALLLLPKQSIEFRVSEGFVTHRGLIVAIDDVPITTSGRVGLLDDSLAIVAEIPIRDDWVNKNKWLAPLKGQVLQLPIGGTLSRPSVDSRVMQDLARRLAESAVGGAVEDQVRDKIFGGQAPEKKFQDEIGKGLKNLFGR